MGTYNWKTRRETFNFWDLVQLILEVWQYVSNDTFDWDKYNHETCACWTHHEPLGLLSLVFVGIVTVMVAKSLKMKSKHQILKIAYWNRKWICWEIIIVFGIMPPNAVTSPPAPTAPLYIEEMADQVLEMYWVEHLMVGLGWWII